MGSLEEACARRRWESGGAEWHGAERRGVSAFASDLSRMKTEPILFLGLSPAEASHKSTLILGRPIGILTHDPEAWVSEVTLWRFDNLAPEDGH